MGNICIIDKQLQIARCMHELMEYVFDLSAGELRNPEHSRFDSVLCRLQQLQESLRADMIADRGYCGAYWWNVPWHAVQNALELNLLKEYECDCWRFETTRELLQDNDRKVLSVQEDGICSRFDTGSEVDYIKRPNLPQEEIDSRLKSFNRKLDGYANYKRFTVDGPVYSKDSGCVYDSMSDYYYSSEYQLLRYRADRILESYMYDPVRTTEGWAISRSLRYGALFTYGSYSVDDTGTLKDLTVRDFSKVHARGEGMEKAGQSLLDKSERVLCAAEIGCDPDVSVVLAEMFDSVIAGESSDFRTAAIDAAMLACLGHKLKGDKVELAQDSFLDQAHYDRVVAIDTKVRQGRQADIDELKLVIDSLNKNLFRLDSSRLLEEKTMYILLLSQTVTDAEESIYWLELGAEMGYSGSRRYSSSRLLGCAVSGYSILSENFLRNKRKIEAQQHCLRGLDACKRLRAIEPNNPALDLEVNLQKNLKKAERRGIFGG